jgi:hypothetical protein
MPQKFGPSRGDEDGKAGDEALAALDQIDRPGQNHLAGVAGPQRCLELLPGWPL